MKYLYTILFILSLLPISAANTLSTRDSSIYVVRGNMQRLQEELIISFELSINRELASNESVVLEPKVVDGLGKEVILPKIYINSRKQHIMVQRGFYEDVNPSNTLMRKNGSQQKFHYLEALPYSKWMESAALVVNEESCGCGLPIANDIAFTTDITTPYIIPAVLPQLAYIMPEETALKLRVDRGSAFVVFPVNDTVVKPSYVNNQFELDKIIQSIDVIKSDSNCTVTEVYIHGYASPEGPYKLNERLARGRSNAIIKYVKDMYNFPSDLLKVESTPEDWIGFEALLVGSSYKYKNEILKIINSNLKPDQKEQKIKAKYPQFFRMLLDDWFIMLRHTDYAIEYEVCFFNTIEDIERIYGSKPNNLSHNELFQLSQYYSEGSEERDNVFMKAVMLYPEDPIANLNAAGVALRRRDVSVARRYLDLAPPNYGETDLAFGVYYLLIEEYDKAGVYLQSAEDKGIQESQQYMMIYQSLTN
ncbi:MAG: hypothetical protein SNI70_03035 [Rikenellaceae bacterium]